MLVFVDTVRGVLGHLKQDVLEHPDLAGLVGRVHLLRRETLSGRKPVVQLLPLQLRDHGPHCGCGSRRVAQILAAGERFGKQRIIDPRMRHAGERQRIERQIPVRAGPVGQLFHRQSLVIGARDNVGA